MKKLVLFLTLILSVSNILLSQTIFFQDNFDSYTAGQYLAAQSDRWTTWSETPGGSDDGLVTTDRALSAPNSILVTGSTDLILRLGDLTEKKYELKFNLFIESGYGGYYNLLHRFGGAGTEWALEVYFAANGTGYMNAGGSNAAQFNYSQNAWVECSNTIDLDADLAQLRIGGTLVHTWQWSLQSGGQAGLKQLGALDLWAGAPSGQIPKFYVDDVIFTGLYSLLDYDVAVKEIIGATQFNAGDSYIPGAIVQNLGLNTVTVDVVCDIMTPGGTKLYTNTQTLTDFKTLSSLIVDFDSFILPMANSLYKVKISNMLPGDQDSSNDTLSTYINTYATARKYVVLEIATGTWCGYCPGAAMGADDLVANGHDVAVIEYHGSDRYENTYARARINYYDVPGYPTAIFDGITSIVGGYHDQSMYSSYVPAYDSRKGVPTAFHVKISGREVSGDNFDLALTVVKRAPSPADNLVLHVVLTESEIPETWQGLTKLDFVERLMLPNESGTRLDFTANDSLEVTLNFTRDPSWVAEHCELVAFIQDLTTKEILQSDKLPLSRLISGVTDATPSGPLTTQLLDNYPNPFNPVTTIRFQLEKPAKVLLEVFNVQGRKVRTLAAGSTTAGEHAIAWDGTDDTRHSLAAGIYFYQFRTDNHIFTKKMLLLR